MEISTNPETNRKQVDDEISKIDSQIKNTNN